MNSNLIFLNLISEILPKPYMLELKLKPWQNKTNAAIVSNNWDYFHANLKIIPKYGDYKWFECEFKYILT